MPASMVCRLPFVQFSHSGVGDSFAAMPAKSSLMLLLGSDRVPNDATVFIFQALSGG